MLAMVFTIVSGLVWGCLFSRAQWESPEPPKNQGEALELLGNGLARHRPLTLAASVREIQNTWSNLGYVLIGAAICLRAASFIGRMLGFALVFLGWSSGIYHASIMPAWRLWDIIGMYWVTYALLAYGAVSLFRRRALTGWGGNALGFIVAMVAAATAVHRNDWKLLGVKPFDSTYVAVGGFFLVGLLIVLSVWRSTGSQRTRMLRWAIGSIAGIGIAATCQLGDRVGNFLFSPGAFIQAHAVWHVMTAAAVGMAYEVFRVCLCDPSLFAKVGIDPVG